MPEGVHVLRITPLNNQPPSSLIDQVAGNSRFQNRQRGVVRISCGLEHPFHSTWDVFRTDEVVPLYVGAVAFVVDAKIELHKVTLLNSIVVIAQMCHRTVADNNGGTAVSHPRSSQASIADQFVREIVNVPVFLPGLNDLFDIVVDFLALVN